jgi:hypothetical protein
MPKKLFTALLIGAGNRGTEIYSAWALAHPDKLRIKTVAEPIEARRMAIASKHIVPTTTSIIPRTVVFDSDRDGNREIYIMDSNGENLINLTNDPADDWTPGWFPDGSQIASTFIRGMGQGKAQNILCL